MSRQTTARTWHFRVRLRMPALSQQEEVRDTFREILISADSRLSIRELEQSSCSYGIPDDGIAEFFGYLHMNHEAKLAKAAVRTWMFDDQIIGDVVWTPIRPGANGDWRQHSLIKSIVGCYMVAWTLAPVA